MTTVCTLSVIIAAILVGLDYLRRYMQGGKYEKSTHCFNKVIIITGANTGIGKETARELASRGGIIYLACRDLKKATQVQREIIFETGNKNVYVKELDLSSLKSIKNFVEDFKKTQQRLDVLINNAGVMACPKANTEDGFEMQIGVNHFGHFYLTLLLLDLLKKSTPSRIVNVSSLVHAWGKIKVDDLQSEKSYDRRSAYNQSKLANVLFTRELARRLKGSNVTVNALHPGAVATELMRHESILSNSIVNTIINGLKWVFFKTPLNGAQTTLYAALDPELENVTGKYFSDCKEKNVGKHAKDNDLAKWLFEESIKLTKISNQII